MLGGEKNQIISQYVNDNSLTIVGKGNEMNDGPSQGLFANLMFVA
jgi:hypothetical protein